MTEAEATLFGNAAKQDIGVAINGITKTPRVVHDYQIVLDGHPFDAENVLETLRETCESGDGYITDQQMIAVLKKLGVILHGGNGRWMTAAQKGENYDMFVNLLGTKIEEM